MENKLTFSSKKVVILSSLTLLFAFLSFVSYNWVEKTERIEQEPALVLVNQIPIDKKEVVEEIKDFESKKQADKKLENYNKEKKNILLLRQITSKYVIVIGTFNEKKNAMNFYNLSLKKGYEKCKVIYNGTSLYWVSFNFYDLVLDAKIDIANYKLDGWIKKIKN